MVRMVTDQDDDRPTSAQSSTTEGDIRPSAEQTLRETKDVFNEWQAMGRFEKFSLGLSVGSFLLSLFPIISNLFGFQLDPLLLAIFAQNAIVMLCLSVALALAYSKYAMLSSKIKHTRDIHNSRMVTVGKTAHTISHCNRDLFTLLATAQNINIKDVNGSLKTYCTALVSLLDETFSDSKLHFHVAIKGLIARDMVATLARDSRTLRESMLAVGGGERDNARRHPIYKNTAFKQLLTANKVVFAHDNLPQYPGGYENSTPNWVSLYNATMVVPLRRNLGRAQNGAFELAGYLGVDCMIPEGSRKPHVFLDADGKPNEAIMQMLFAFADSAFAIVKRGKIVNRYPEQYRTGELIVDDENYSFITQLNDELRRGP